MDRNKAQQILEAYGKPSFKVNENTKLTFSRQSTNDLNIIEEMSNDKLLEEYKSLIFMNFIYDQVSLNELQRIDLMELEIESRDSINFKEIDVWYEEAVKDFDLFEESQSLN